MIARCDVTETFMLGDTPRYNAVGGDLRIHAISADEYLRGIAILVALAVFISDTNGALQRDCSTINCLRRTHETP